MNEIIGDIARKSPMMGGMLMMGLQSMNEIEERNEQWKERLRKEWQETKKMPRKMKKRRRKEILIDWSIANWSPFNEYKF